MITIIGKKYNLKFWIGFWS